MSRPFSTEPAVRKTPLDADERARAEANFADLVVAELGVKGSFRVSADTPEMVELFQGVARTVGERLGRPVVSYANGRYLVIAFDQPRS
ncbi:hypothetical protein ACIBG7_19305 [Nonomuraea sp. NPDC050328]|uniref:hypothetical protein n=1 Tax=Nonomuraea sp. NPDC050328 TaxID=3364361 RepID=UPI00378BDCA2